MSSHLQNHIAFEAFSAHNTAASYPHTISRRPETRQRMGVASTYRLAHQARSKLSVAASAPDHDLHRLVGHANLLDSLMLDLQNAERDQEAWFNKSSTPAPVVTAVPEEPKLQWADSVEQFRLDVPDNSDEEEEDSDDDSESDFEIEEVIARRPARQQSQQQQRARSPPAQRHIYEDDSDDEDMEVDDEYDNLSLSLQRSPTNRMPSSEEHDVPDLVHDSSDDSDDDAPSSPESPELDAAHVLVKDFAAAIAKQQQSQHYISKPSSQMAPMVAAY